MHMKILLALFAIALAAVLVVSATLGAGTLIPGDGGPGKPPGRVGGGPTGRPQLIPVGSAPLTLKGIGFEAGETVTVRSADNPVQSRRTVKASATGSFVVRLGRSVDRCNGGTVLATGNRGSKAGFNFAPTVCAVPGQAG
jgi:hypothetical protein